MSWGDHEHDEIRKRLGTDKRKEPKKLEHSDGARGGMRWRRYRFRTKAVEDYRPLVVNPKYPWWCSGFSGDGESATIIAYLPSSENLREYWDDAYSIEYTEESEIKFTGRFPKPKYFSE